MNLCKNQSDYKRMCIQLEHRNRTFDVMIIYKRKIYELFTNDWFGLKIQPKSWQHLYWKVQFLIIDFPCQFHMQNKKSYVMPHMNVFWLEFTAKCQIDIIYNHTNMFQEKMGFRQISCWHLQKYGIGFRLDPPLASCLFLLHICALMKGFLSCKSKSQSRKKKTTSFTMPLCW